MAQGSGPGPSLGFQGQNLMVNSDFGSVRSGHAGTWTYPDRKFRSVSASNFRFRSDMPNPNTDSESTQRHWGFSGPSYSPNRAVARPRKTPVTSGLTLYDSKFCVESELSNSDPGNPNLGPGPYAAARTGSNG